MSKQTEKSYDQLPYDSYPFAETHISHLCSIGTIFGINPAAIDNCRVLEVGAASGGNLIPMAYHFPKSEFLGIDLSERQVADGHNFIEELKLSNIKLEKIDIKDFSKDFNKDFNKDKSLFDYIIIHGVFSWVPDDVKNTIFTLCKNHLSEQGIAYISYNTFPGWYLRSAVRDLMKFHTKESKGLLETLQQGRSILELFQSFLEDKSNSSNYSAALKEVVQQLSSMPAWYVYHELLAENNTPMYFHDFIARAKEHQLSYLADADLSIMFDTNFESSICEKLEEFKQDSIRLDQYIDFFRNRILRRSLLVHDNLTIDLDVGKKRITELLVGSPVKPSQKNTANKSSSFELGNRGEIYTEDPLVKAALAKLSAVWPESIPFKKLLNAAEDGVAEKNLPKDQLPKDQLTEQLLQLFFKGAVVFDTLSLNCTRSVHEKPKTTDLIRRESMRRARVSGAQHNFVVLDDFSRVLLAILDGEHDEDDLFEIMSNCTVTIHGTIPGTIQGTSKDEDRVFDLKNITKEKWQEWYRNVIEELALKGLLVN